MQRVSAPPPPKSDSESTGEQAVDAIERRKWIPLNAHEPPRKQAAGPAEGRQRDGDPLCLLGGVQGRRRGLGRRHGDAVGPRVSGLGPRVWGLGEGRRRGPAEPL